MTEAIARTSESTLPIGNAPFPIDFATAASEEKPSFSDRNPDRLRTFIALILRITDSVVIGGAAIIAYALLRTDISNLDLYYFEVALDILLAAILFQQVELYKDPNMVQLKARLRGIVGAYSMGAAAAVVVGVLALSALAFGIDAWKGFFGPTLTTQGLMLRQGHGPFMWMMPSAYMSARTFHWPMVQALEAQAPFTLLAAALTAWAWWRRDKPLELRAAILMMATFVASPQAFNYDLIPAGVAALVLLRRDRLVFIGLPLAVLVWAAPVAMMALEWVHAPVTPLVLAAALVRLAMLPDAERPARRARPPVPAAA